jgi:hypothetical protein
MLSAPLATLINDLVARLTLLEKSETANAAPLASNGYPQYNPSLGAPSWGARNLKQPPRPLSKIISRQSGYSLGL